MMLEIKNLSVALKSKNNFKYLLNDISFSLEKGDCLGIIGKSGAGKSTLTKALLQIYEENTFCESGSVIYDNKPFTKDLRGKVFSLVFQNPNTYLNPLMKIGKQISEMLVYHYKESKKNAKNKTIELMSKVKLPNPEKLYNYYPFQLSGGMKQKVCLCIALICKCEVLIMDESTSYLDKNSEQEILEIVKEFQKEYKFTLIIISHDFKLIYSMCNKIAIMEEGEIVEFGTKEEVVFSFMHPHTLELLCTYLNFHNNLDYQEANILHNKISNGTSIIYYSNTHFTKKFDCNENFLKNKKEIKEKLYESFGH